MPIFGVPGCFNRWDEVVRASHKSPPPAKPLVELRQLLAERGDALMYLRVNTWPRSLWETSGQQVCHTQMVHFRDAVPKSDPTKIDHDQTFPRMPGRQFRKKERRKEVCGPRKIKQKKCQALLQPTVPPTPQARLRTILVRAHDGHMRVGRMHHNGC